ncbi:MAG: DoxX family membrane protein [Saprospiraceae bacterium]
MNAVLSLGRWLLAIPILVFGVFHFVGAEGMSGIVPSYFPGGVIWVYITGVASILFAVSVVIGKYDKLAAVLLAALMLIYILTIHLPGAMGGNQSSTVSLLKDLIIAGAALMYARHEARDRAIIG